MHTYAIKKRRAFACSTKGTFSIFHRWKNLHVSLPSVQQLNFRHPLVSTERLIYFFLELVLSARKNKKEQQDLFKESASKLLFYFIARHRTVLTNWAGALAGPDVWMWQCCKICCKIGPV